MATQEQIESALRHPVSWAAGGIFSVFAVLASVGVDPITTVSVLLSVGVNNAMTIFTGASIFGFTLGPEISGLPVIGTIPTAPFKAIAVVFGLIAVGKIVLRLWDNFKQRLRGD